MNFTPLPYHMLPNPLHNPYLWYTTEEMTAASNHIPSVATSTPQRTTNYRPFYISMKSPSNSDITTPPTSTVTTEHITKTTSTCTVALSDQSPATPTTVNTSTSSAKENDPPIPIIPLIQPQMVVEKYPKLLLKSKLKTLAIKLVKEAYFGKN